ncbi:hypothetical protein ROZALSC1DRAFT_29805 [Rozella allomycis CSF55]|uniref:Dynein heavy chain linker domain-containing protein n=1 Tax=Rozella allomycis (strain CSF55) TaxID=988480 RepID=A0A4P9YG97_ROZAC|nr:hypothetical protein ROZALSC1DRAFT_29805 [Rozella allomycis CSF55]
MKVPSTTEELCELINYLDKNSADETTGLKEEIYRGIKRINFLLNYAQLTEEDIKLNSVTMTWPERIGPIFDLSKKRLVQKKTKAQEEVKIKSQNLEAEVESLLDIVYKFQDCGILSETNEYVKKLRSIEIKIDELSFKIKEINKEEELLEFDLSPFGKFEEAKEALGPFKLLWDSVSTFQNEYNRWMTSAFIELDAHQIDDQVGNLYKSILKLTKTFKDLAVPRKVSEQIKNKIEKFKAYIPLITILRSPGLKNRHWKEMSDVAGVDMTPDEETTLSTYLEMDLSAHIPKFEEISEVAMKEFNFEKTLANMMEEWKNMTFNHMPYRDSGTFTLTAQEDLQALMNDQIIKIQTLKNSPLARNLEDLIAESEQTLMNIKETWNEWLKVQSGWLRLEPIFSSEETSQQMPLESRNFKQVDKIWREIMTQCLETPEILIMIKTPNLLEKLKECNSLIEEIQKVRNEQNHETPQ